MNRLTSVCAAIGLCVACIGCVSPYSRFYKPMPNAKFDATKHSECENAAFERGTDPNQDIVKYMEQGYYPIGFSSFNMAGQPMESQMYAMAKDLKACLIVAYDPKYTRTDTGHMTTFVPGSFIGSAISIPMNTDRFDYLVTYWVKARTGAMKLGAYTQDLPQEVRVKVGSNRGAMVTAVVKGTPAFSADMIRGDVIRKFDDTDVVDAAHFGEMLSAKAGRIVRFEIIREGKPVVIDVKLNS